MFRRIVSISSLLLASPLGVIPDAGAADDVCLPEASPTPAWWNPGLTAQQKESRWAGAVERKLSTDRGTATVRTLWSPDQHTVYFEFTVAGDVSLDPADDAVVVALSDETGTLPALFIRFAPLQECAPIGPCTGAGVELSPTSVEYAEVSASPLSLSWTAISNTHANPNFVVEHPWVSAGTLRSGYRWRLSFALRVPVDGSDEIVPDLRIYANAMMYESGPISGTVVEFPLLCTSSSPISNDCLVYGASEPELPEDLPVWTMTSSWPLLESGGCGALLSPPG